MTRNSKNARNIERARQISLMHKEGKKMASATSPKHNKRVTYRTNPEISKRIAEQIKATATPSTKTSGQQILETAGAASRV